MKKSTLKAHPPGSDAALRLLTEAWSHKRLMKLIHQHAPGVVEIDRLVRLVIVAVARNYDPATRPLWPYVTNYIRRVALNMTRPEALKSLRTDPLPGDDEPGALAADDHFTRLYEEIDIKPFRAALRQEWGRLTLAEGYVLFLRFWAGMSVKEVAALGAKLHPGRTEAAVKSCTQRAFQKLRRPLSALHPRGRCVQAGKNPPTHGRHGRRPRGGARGAA